MTWNEGMGKREKLMGQGHVGRLWYKVWVKDMGQSRNKGMGKGHGMRTCDKSMDKCMGQRHWKRAWDRGMGQEHETREWDKGLGQMYGTRVQR